MGLQVWSRCWKQDRRSGEIVSPAAALWTSVWRAPIWLPRSRRSTPNLPTVDPSFAQKNRASPQKLYGWRSLSSPAYRIRAIPLLCMGQHRTPTVPLLYFMAQLGMFALHRYFVIPHYSPYPAEASRIINKRTLGFRSDATMVLVPVAVAHHLPDNKLGIFGDRITQRDLLLQRG
jgi:hypothetical protein